MPGAIAEISIYGKVLPLHKEGLKLLLENETSKSKWALSWAMIFVHSLVPVEIKWMHKGYSHQLVCINCNATRRGIWVDNAKNIPIFSTPKQKRYKLGLIANITIWEFERDLSSFLSEHCSMHRGTWWNPCLHINEYEAISQSI